MSLRPFPSSPAALRWAVGLSLLAHFLVLWPSSAIRSWDASDVVLSATLKMPGPAFSSSQDVPTAFPYRSRHETPSPTPQLNTPASGLAPALRPESLRGIVEPLDNSSSSIEPVASVNATPSADGLRHYRLALASQARRLKHYSVPAIVAGVEGTAEIRLEVGEAGRTPRTSLHRSSGIDALDQAALAIITAAAEHAVLPEPLRGQRFVLTLPVVFDVDPR